MAQKIAVCYCFYCNLSVNRFNSIRQKLFFFNRIDGKKKEKI